MKKLIALLLALTVILSFAACGKTAAPSQTTAATTEAVESHYPITITDQAGREVVIEKEPQKLVSGYDAKTFAPNDTITREQLAVILWRFAEMADAPRADLDFADADQVSEYAIPALLWATGEHLFPVEDGLLRPGDPATRAETAQLLMNFLCR